MESKASSSRCCNSTCSQYHTETLHPLSYRHSQVPTTLSLPHESRAGTEGDPRGLCSPLPRSASWVRLCSPAEQRESLGCRDVKPYRAVGFLKQGNGNLPPPELASPLLLAHSHDGAGKCSHRHTHRSTLHRPKPTLLYSILCVDV